MCSLSLATPNVRLTKVYVFMWSLAECQKQEKVSNGSVLKEVEVAYDRWSLERDSNCCDLSAWVRANVPDIGGGGWCYGAVERWTCNAEAQGSGVGMAASWSCPRL